MKVGKKREALRIVQESRDCLGNHEELLSAYDVEDGNPKFPLLQDSPGHPEFRPVVDHRKSSGIQQTPPSSSGDFQSMKNAESTTNSFHSFVHYGDDLGVNRRRRILLKVLLSR